MASKASAKKPAPIPRFTSDEEAAAYFDTHDTGEVAESLPAAGPIIDGRKPLKPISLRLPNDTIASAKRVARQRGIGYQTLLRVWIVERLKKELRRVS